MKEYTILTSSSFAHPTSQETCSIYSAMLPEPRSRSENDFLASLGPEMFLLGLTDTDREGTWVYDSDLSPLTWSNWRGGTDPAPNGGTGENCAFMVRNLISGTGTLTEWEDSPCSSNSYFDSKPRTLICQKKGR